MLSVLNISYWNSYIQHTEVFFITLTVVWKNLYIPAELSWDIFCWLVLKSAKERMNSMQYIDLLLSIWEH